MSPATTASPTHRGSEPCAGCERLAVGSPLLVYQRLERLLLQLVSTCRDPAALPYLLDLTRHSRADLAQSAITALRERREPTVAAALVTALNHPDQAVRYQAVLGLAELGHVPDGGPALPRFRRDEPGYLQRWKAWWQARRV